MPVTFTEYTGQSVCMHETVLECVDSFMKFYIGNFYKKKSICILAQTVLLTIFCEVLDAFMCECWSEL